MYALLCNQHACMHGSASAVCQWVRAPKLSFCLHRYVPSNAGGAGGVGVGLLYINATDTAAALLRALAHQLRQQLYQVNRQGEKPTPTNPSTATPTGQTQVKQAVLSVPTPTKQPNKQQPPLPTSAQQPAHKQGGWQLPRLKRPWQQPTSLLGLLRQQLLWVSYLSMKRQ